MDKKLLFASNRLGVKKDYFKFAFDLYAHHAHIQIAVPFFTNSDQILSIVNEQDCTVDLVICLNQATSPDAIEAVMDNPDVNIRYLVDTQEKFHSKLYIFGSEIAFVGSSNMTWQGLNQNIELNLGIESDDPRFEHIEHIFDYYWEEAKAINENVLEEFRVRHDQYPRDQHIDPIAQDLAVVLGDSGFDRIENRNEKNLLPRKIELFEKHYQKVVNQYQKLRDVYESVGKRKSTVLPLLWEIDQFLSWLYQSDHESMEQWDEKKTRNLISKFIDADFDYISVLEDSFLANTQAAEKIKQKNLDEQSLGDFMRDVHAFVTRKRYHINHERLFATFLEENSLKRIQDTFHYLLFASASPYERMAQCIYDSEYKLSQIGESCVKEIFGRNNDRDFPICNGRTMDAMKMLGMQV